MDRKSQPQLFMFRETLFVLLYEEIPQEEAVHHQDGDHHLQDLTETEEGEACFITCAHCSQLNMQSVLMPNISCSCVLVISR